MPGQGNQVFRIVHFQVANLQLPGKWLILRQHQRQNAHRQAVIAWHVHCQQKQAFAAWRIFPGRLGARKLQVLPAGV